MLRSIEMLTPLSALTGVPINATFGARDGGDVALVDMLLSRVKQGMYQHL